MNLIDSLKVALRGLSANKMRTGLTMLGIIIGVGSVIALMSVGKGAEAGIVSRIQSMGTNLLFVSPGSTQSSGVRTASGSAATLTVEDGNAIKSEISTVAAVAPETTSMVQAVYGSTNTRSRVTGTTPEYLEVRSFNVGKGEFFTQQHVDSHSTVCVLGSETAKTLFGDADPLDQSIRLSAGSGTGFVFKVLGVMESKGSQAMGNQDEVIFVPITTVQDRLSMLRTSQGGRTVQTINVQVTSESAMTQATQQIGELLRERHKVVEDDFQVRSQEDMLSTASEVSGTLTMLLGAIAGISLLVGGIGIMNIMLVSVTERTREIGIRKAVGATKQDVLTQFLVEAVVVSVAGGGIGVAVGVGFSKLMSGMTMGGQALQTVVAPESVALAFAVSAAIGVFFGIYPATRAAGLNPIDALHYE